MATALAHGPAAEPAESISAAIPTTARSEQRDRPPVRIGLADDRANARRELRALLERRDDLQVLGEHDEGAEGPSNADARPDVLVLELHRPGADSIDAIRSLSRSAPSVRIVVICDELDPMFARQALRSGAFGYVLRDSAERELPDAVRRAADGLGYVSPRVAAALSALGAPGGRLTQRELEVLRLTALGFTGSEIAGQLRLSRRTVDSHRATIHRKLGLASRAELVREALRRGLLGS
jgi:two-component system response regulator NreC